MLIVLIWCDCAAIRMTQWGIFTDTITKIYVFVPYISEKMILLDPKALEKLCNFAFRIDLWIPRTSTTKFSLENKINA